MKIRTYNELQQFKNFEDRYRYLKLGGSVGATTFGFDRYINQAFYKSREWKQTREFVIIRDNGCDLGVDGYEIHGGLLVHHINPISEDDIINHEDWIFSPEYLITTTQATHNAIHYGNAAHLVGPLIERSRGDTKLW